MVNQSIASAFSNIADAIRAKTGENRKYTPAEMPEVISNNISGGIPFDQHKVLVNNDGSYEEDGWFNYDYGVTFTGNKSAATTFSIVKIGNNITSCSSMLSGCIGCNVAIYIPDSVTNCAYMFYASGMNVAPSHISNSVIDCTSMFERSYFNTSITIPDSVINCQNMFYLAQNFGSFDECQVTFGNSVENCYTMFAGCHNLNMPVTISDSVINCANMFSNCWNFRKSVTIGNSVTDCSNMFYNCVNYNAPIIISDSVINCYQMFMNCNNFNSPVVIGNSVENCVNMFCYCNKFSQSITIPNSVINCYYMFAYYNGNNGMKGVNVYFGTPSPDLYVGRMFFGINTRLSLNIFTKNVSPFLGNNTYTSITGQNGSWTARENGYYYGSINIYYNDPE